MTHRWLSTDPPGPARRSRDPSAGGLGEPPAARSGHQPASAWPDLPAALDLRSHDVDVWRVHLDHPAWPLEQIAGLLSPDEQERASTFAFARDRQRFQVSRGVVRLLLAGYVDVAPDAITFRYGPNGKPELAVETSGDPRASGHPRVEFNASRSRGLALCAFARGRRVGVDLEALRRLPEAEGVADRCFSRRERSELAALSHGDLEGAVLRGWTRKEAYAKAVGDGLTRPLDGIEVSVSPTEPPALRAIHGDPLTARRWSLVTLSPDAGYVAALVVEGHDYELTCRAGQPTTPPLRCP